MGALGTKAYGPLYCLPLAIVLGALRMLVVAAEVRPSLFSCLCAQERDPGSLLGPFVAAKQ